MAFCTNCGNQVADGIKFCTSCGASMAGNVQAAQPQPATQPQQLVVQTQQPVQQPYAQQLYVQQPYAAPPQPGYAAPPAAAVYQEEPISTGGYIGILLLMAVPIVNLICMIVWACGGCKKVNKRNLSRAMLVLMLISIILGGLAMLAGNMLFGDVFNEIKDLGTELGNMPME